MTNFAAMDIVVNPRGLAEQRVAYPQCAKGRGDTALGVNMLASRIPRRGRKPRICFVRPDGAAPSDLNDELRRRRT